MRRILNTSWVYVFAVVVFVSAITFFATAQSNGSTQADKAVFSTHAVLTDAGYMPRAIVLKKGGTVTFSTTINKPHWPASNLHPSHEIYPEFDPGRPLASDETWSFRFERLGTFNFHDHLRAYYSGTIYVVE